MKTMEVISQFLTENQVEHKLIESPGSILADCYIQLWTNDYYRIRDSMSGSQKLNMNLWVTSNNPHTVNGSFINPINLTEEDSLNKLLTLVRKFIDKGVESPFYEPNYTYRRANWTN